MYTAMLTLDRAWLVDVLAPTVNPLQMGTRQTSTDSDASDGEFRMLAGGRTQLITKDAAQYLWPIEFAAITPAQLGQLSQWKGRVLCLRTIDGTRQFAGYLSYTIKRYYNLSMDNGLTRWCYDVDITFTSVSYQEAV